MAIDLNAQPEEEEEEVPDLNKSPTALEDHDPLLDVVAEVGLHPDMNDEQEQSQQGDNTGHPFDLNDPHVQDQENVHQG
ncbi:unnamed protein product, partial [Urochloa humidicola]